jgi:hypothetical protein
MAMAQQQQLVTRQPCRICATCYSFISASATFSSFKRWAERREAWWIAIPLGSGEVAVLCSEQRRQAEKVEDAEAWLRLWLDQHDRARRVTASSSIRIDPRVKIDPAQTWFLPMSVEDAMRLAEESGLTVHWRGVGYAVIPNLKQTDVDTLVARLT